MGILSGEFDDRAAHSSSSWPVFYDFLGRLGKRFLGILSDFLSTRRHGWPEGALR